MVTYLLPLNMVEIREYLDDTGGSPFKKWFDKLDAIASAKVTIFLTRVEQGNLNNCKRLGAGVWELKIDFGAGYRVYFGKDGEKIVILLGGGTKKRQQKDIEEAKNLWARYKLRKKQE